MSVAYTNDLIQPIRHYLVRIKGLRDEYVKGQLKRVFTPSPLWDETNGLCEEGIIEKVPLGADDSCIGKKVIFSFLEAHNAIKKDSLYVSGCLMILPESIIQIEDEMQGQWLFCKRVGIKKSRVLLPTMKKEAFDSSRKGEVKVYDYELDKGIIDRPNQHLPVGTPVYWGKASYANKEWQMQGGFLVKFRSLKAYGTDILKWKSLNV